MQFGDFHMKYSSLQPWRIRNQRALVLQATTIWIHGFVQNSKVSMDWLVLEASSSPSSLVHRAGDFISFDRWINLATLMCFWMFHWVQIHHQSSAPQKHPWLCNRAMQPFGSKTQIIVWSFCKAYGWKSCLILEPDHLEQLWLRPWCIISWFAEWNKVSREIFWFNPALCCPERLKVFQWEYQQYDIIFIIQLFA